MHVKDSEEIERLLHENDSEVTLLHESDNEILNKFLSTYKYESK